MAIRTNTARLDFKRAWVRQYQKTEFYKERRLNHHYARADAMFRELRQEGI